MQQNEQKRLELNAAKIRRWSLEQVYCAASGHIGGSLSIAEILSVLYWKQMRNDPKKPKDPDRDRLVLSKGHCSPALYAALALRGYLPLEDLKTFRDIDSYLSGHVEMKHVPGVDMSAGSLGQGLSAAVGMALVGKMDKKGYRCYAILGDGECQEGQIWEAAMAAGHYKLDNLVVIVDNNNLQISGSLPEVMTVDPIDEKFAAFGFHVIKVDGHDVAALDKAFEDAKGIKGKPVALVAATHKGNGVSFMKDNYKWHGSPPNDEQYEQARGELDAVVTALEKEVGANA